jgi:flagellar FliL protein
MAAPTRPSPPAPQKAPAAKQAAPPAAPEGEAPAAPTASRRGALLPAIVIAVALLIAAFMLKGGGGGGSDTPAAANPATSATAAADGASDAGDPAEVVALDAITLNLADGRFLKLGLALQLAPGTEVSDADSFGARALDQTIDLLGTYTYKDLSVKGARAKAKEKLSKAVSEAYDGKVLSVYFTEFVMQ